MEKEDSNFHSKSLEELFKELNSSKKGLTNDEAGKRLVQYGTNTIKKKNKLKPLKIILEQFNSFLIYILIIAGVLMVYLGHMMDAIVIFAIVLLNAGIGFFQQYKAEKAIMGLRKLLVQKSKVIRNGKFVEILSSELVPGDIVVLEQGDRINADCRLIEVENLETNEAVLTGESLPVPKFLKKLAFKTNLAKRENMLFMGTQVVKGKTKALVVSTGMKTVFGKIADTLQGIETRKTPMQKKLDTFSKQLGLIILGLVLLILLVGAIYKFDLLQMFLTSVALAVSAIPEGLPAVLAIAFSISSVMLAKKNVIIRRLPAVEALGSVTVICSDKTGTLTEEKMSIQQIFANNNLYTKSFKKLSLKNKEIDLVKNKEISQLIKTSILCNSSRYELMGKEHKFIGDPTENTLVRNALDLNFDKKILIEKEPSVKKFEFDSKRKLMSILRDNGRSNTLYTKGAAEKIMAISSHELIDGQIKKLTQKRKEQLLEESKKMEKDALRVLGFAYKNFNKNEKVSEQGLIFLGFAGMIDPPRKEVKDAIAQCKSAGIKVKIITGDSALTAISIGKQIGITGEVVTEEELEKMSDAELMQRVDKIEIFARTTPHQKLRITKILQQKNEVVAITGDGINDVLALKSADIGIAMGQRGTDVARDVSDIVLIDDNFASLVEGVKQGRRTYDNVKKFTKYLLSVNFSAIILIMLLIIMGYPLPLLPLQILWMNLITDSFPALSLVFEKEEGVMKTKPRKERSILSGIWKFIIIGGIIAFAAELAVYMIGTGKNLPIEEIRTMVLTTAIIFELLFVYACRSNKSLKDVGIFSNKWLNIAVLGGLALHLILLYTPLSTAFKVVPLTLNGWLFILPFGAAGLIIFEGWKYIRYKKQKTSKNIVSKLKTIRREKE